MTRAARLRPPHPHVLREYSLLADGERGAVVGPCGDIAWLCAPRWDSPSVFSTLIGGSGHYTVCPGGRFVWGGEYEDGSMIWRSRWVTEEGVVESRECLAYPGDKHRLILLRRVAALNAPARVAVQLCPRADYDQSPLSELRQHRGVWTARLGDLYLRWTAGPGVRRQTQGNAVTLTLDLDLAAGDRHDLMLEISDEELPDDLPDSASLWAGTESAWRSAVPHCDDLLAAADTRHSFAVLRGLTTGDGGMVAAATTSLPERADAGRNYDYRYVWIRDQCYAGVAVAAAGHDDLLDCAVSFVTARLLADTDHLEPGYTVRGESIPAPRHLGLPGYPGGADLVGNRVADQFQLDAYGEALQLLAVAASRGRADGHAYQAMTIAADAIRDRWTEPDAGIWEIDNRPWTHSRLTAAAGLRAAAGTPEASDPRAWSALADEIVADTAAHALHPKGYWQRSPDDPAVDAALLLPGLRGAVAPDDPRTAATLQEYLRELTVDGYAYRFRHDSRPLPEAEGSFLLCGFIVALALHQQGEQVEARAWFERTRSACGPPQLFSEEYDQRQNQMRGNVPQAFVHALMIECAARLAR